MHGDLGVGVVMDEEGYIDMSWFAVLEKRSMKGKA